MQTVTVAVNHLTGKGWKTTERQFQCDETVGTSQGRDKYAVARGTAIKFMRALGIFHQSTWAVVKVDGMFINIRIEGDKFVKSDPKPLPTY